MLNGRVVRGSGIARPGVVGHVRPIAPHRHRTSSDSHSPGRHWSAQAATRTGHAGASRRHAGSPHIRSPSAIRGLATVLGRATGAPFAVADRTGNDLAVPQPPRTAPHRTVDGAFVGPLAGDVHRLPEGGLLAKRTTLGGVGLHRPSLRGSERTGTRRRSAARVADRLGQLHPARLVGWRRLDLRLGAEPGRRTDRRRDGEGIEQSARGGLRNRQTVDHQLDPVGRLGGSFGRGDLAGTADLTFKEHRAGLGPHVHLVSPHRLARSELAGHGGRQIIGTGGGRHRGRHDHRDQERGPRNGHE